jgi:hypothetical protein
MPSDVNVFVMVLSAPITLACQTDSNISGVLM